MGKHARQVALEKFDFEMVARKYFQLYKDILEEDYK
jgi:hypothetical protein